MLRIAICDDDIVGVNNLIELVSRYQEKHNLNFEIKSFTSGKELLESDLSKYDLIFLDVDMGTENGIDIAVEIRKVNQKLILVYVSGYIQYAPAGYQVKAFAYILKRDLFENFEITMDDVMKEYHYNQQTYKFKSDEMMINIPINNILFIESFNRTTDIHTIDWPVKCYTTKLQLNNIANDLAIKGFLQIHKSYVINMNHTIKMKNYIATLIDNSELPVSQRKWRDILAQFIAWKGRM